jgi:DHA2 family multidrug resistance protein
VMFILPIFMSRVLHLDATQTGMMFIPGAILTAFTMPFIGKALAKVDARVLIFIGTVIILGMLYIMTGFSSMTGRDQVYWSLIVRGAGMGFLFVPINAVVLGQFRGSDLGQVAGLMNLLRQIGGSVGIALMDTLLERNTHQNLLDLSSHVSTLNPGTQAALLKMGVQDLSNVDGSTLRHIFMRMDQQVYMMSFTQMIWYVFIIYCLSFIPIFLLKTPGKIDAKAAMDAH